MSSEELIPYAMARRRFLHACSELRNQDRPINERLLNAIVALSPLRPEDMPRTCQLRYEKVQHLIGHGLWHSNAAAGALSSAIRSLSFGRATIAVQWIVMANDSLDKHCGVSSATRVDMSHINASESAVTEST